MRSRLLLGLLTLLGLALPLLAQGGVADSASNSMIADALRSLNVRFALEDDHYAIDLPGRVIRLYRLDGGSRLLLKGSIKAQPSLATINRYNEKVAVTTRAVPQTFTRRRFA